MSGYYYAELAASYRVLNTCKFLNVHDSACSVNRSIANSVDLLLSVVINCIILRPIVLLMPLRLSIQASQSNAITTASYNHQFTPESFTAMPLGGPNFAIMTPHSEYSSANLNVPSCVYGSSVPHRWTRLLSPTACTAAS